jgi:hypothetical protein
MKFYQLTVNSPPDLERTHGHFIPLPSGIGWTMRWREKVTRSHWANPATMKQYPGLKHADDQHDACWLAAML